MGIVYFMNLSDLGPAKMICVWAKSGNPITEILKNEWTLSYKLNGMCCDLELGGGHLDHYWAGMLHIQAVILTD